MPPKRCGWSIGLFQHKHSRILALSTRQIFPLWENMHAAVQQAASPDTVWLIFTILGAVSPTKVKAFRGPEVNCRTFGPPEWGLSGLRVIMTTCYYLLDTDSIKGLSARPSMFSPLSRARHLVFHRRHGHHAAPCRLVAFVLCFFFPLSLQSFSKICKPSVLFIEQIRSQTNTRILPKRSLTKLMYLGDNNINIVITSNIKMDNDTKRAKLGARRRGLVTVISCCRLRK